jgi:hypothetical protein
MAQRHLQLLARASVAKASSFVRAVKTRTRFASGNKTPLHFLSRRGKEFGCRREGDYRKRKFHVTLILGRHVSSVRSQLDSELIAVTGFLGCQDVMTKFPQFFDDRKREVFVTVQTRHPLSFLVFLYCLVDLFSARPVIGPSDRQVGLGQVRVMFSDLLIGQPQPAPRNETRDRVPRISNAWLATTHS